MFSLLKSKLKLKNSYIGVVGAGYVGLPFALNSSKYIKTIVYDNNSKRIKLLNSGKTPLNTIKSKTIKDYLKTKNSFSSKIIDLINVDIIIVCLPTPLNKRLKPDLSFLINFFKDLAKFDLSNKIIILESSSYPGTSNHMIEILNKSNKYEVGKNIFFGYSPEREDPGNKKFKNTDIIKIVSGYTDNCLKLCSDIYQILGFKIFKSSNIETAEFCKLYENSFRSVNIAFVNQAKELALKSGININEIVKLASTKKFGFMPFYPGPGIGGHCIPIDPVYLSYYSKIKFDYNFSLIEESNEIHKLTSINLLKRINTVINKNFDKKIIKIIIFGCTYKKNVNDFRESPAISIVNKLNKKINYKISICDPYIDDSNDIFEKSITRYKSFFKVKNFDLGILLTDHDIFDEENILNSSKILIDTRNFIHKSKSVIKI